MGSWHVEQAFCEQKRLDLPLLVVVVVVVLMASYQLVAGRMAVSRRGRSGECVSGWSVESSVSTALAVVGCVGVCVGVTTGFLSKTLSALRNPMGSVSTYSTSRASELRAPPPRAPLDSQPRSLLCPGREPSPRSSDNRAGLANTTTTTIAAAAAAASAVAGK